MVGRVTLLLFSLFVCDVVSSQTIQYTKECAEFFYQQAIKEHEQGRDSSAYVLTQNAISILDVLGSDSISLYAECKHNAGMFALLGLRDSLLFSRNMQEAIKIKKTFYGESNDYFWSNQCYADGLVLLAESVAFPKMISLYEKAINVYEMLPNHDIMDSYQRALNNLSVYYERIDIERSIKLANKLLSIQKKNNIGDSLQTISNLAAYYTDVDTKTALFYAKRVLEIRSKKYPEDLDGIRKSHHRIATVYSRLKDYKNAIIHSNKARELASKIYGEESWQYSLSAQNLGLYYMMSGDTIKGLKYAKIAYSVTNSDKINNAINLAGIYCTLNKQDSCYKYTVESWNAYKYKLVSELCEMSDKNRFLYAVSYENYNVARLPLHYYTQYKNDENFKRLAYDCILFNKNIANDCMNNEKLLNRTLKTNFDSVKSYLGEHDVAIDFFCYREDSVIDEKSGDLIVSIVKKGLKAPLFITLSIENIKKTLNNKFETTELYLPLYENIWREIVDVAKLKEGDKLYISLDDFLYNVPIENICGYDWKYMGDKYDIRFVSSMSEIPNIKDMLEKTDASLFGGLTYDSSDVNELYIDETAKLKIDNIYNELEDTVLSELRSYTNYLPWTKTETDSVYRILSTCKDNVKIVRYQGGAGTEDAFKSLSGKSPSIIHIATHGFSISRPDDEMTWYDYYIYCMEHTGLLFSGALVSREKDEDGFLRSTEIAPLILDNTELLVLSACKTGIGGSTPIGNVGLQRAFKAAGVGTILMTLNDVDDAATCAMIVAFYKYLTEGFSKYEAFKKAQLMLRKSDMFNLFNIWAFFRLID